MSKSTEVATTTPIYDTESLSSIKSFEDALRTLNDADVRVTDITDYGDGFAVIDKAELIGRKFVILDYKYAESSDYTNENGEPLSFVIVRCVTEDGTKAVFTDGSLTSGIKPQMDDLNRRGVMGGVLCPRGLTVSAYTYTDPKGKSTAAKTYYLGM